MPPNDLIIISPPSPPPPPTAHATEHCSHPVDIRLFHVTCFGAIEEQLYGLLAAARAMCSLCPVRAEHYCPPYPPLAHPGLTSVPDLPLHVLVPTLDSVLCVPASRILLVDSLSPLPGSLNLHRDHSVTGQTLKARTTPWTLLYDKTFPGESQHTLH